MERLEEVKQKDQSEVIDDATFQKKILDYHYAHFRPMPWRANTHPYYVLVSEIMLQQTQVSRVIPKFDAFMKAFPTIQALAAAPLADVLTQWVGLGYNRRANFLHQAAKMIINEFNGIFPDTDAELKKLPGVGVNTAGAIMAYAFNKPAVFIETNVRTVYIHHFFADQTDVSDNAIRELLVTTLANQSVGKSNRTIEPRVWYWALMDYGAHLKATLPSNIAKSRHYKKQSKFAGSLRQLRGGIVRQLAVSPMSQQGLETLLPDERLQVALAGLANDGLIEQRNNILYLTGDTQVS